MSAGAAGAAASGGRGGGGGFGCVGGMRVGRGRIRGRALGGVCTRRRTWWSGSAGERGLGHGVLLSGVTRAEVDLAAALSH